ncbi:MAG: hypothetical protein CME24_03580 [Gemmatimonadetes bacterium]|nr:hypothetical protein [Gemmatimonadota bacterium]
MAENPEASELGEEPVARRQRPEPGWGCLRHSRVGKTGPRIPLLACATVQNAVFSAYGIVTRKITSDRCWDDYGRSVHHGINEVWSNDFAKWILLDAKFNNHFEKAGVSLSAP